MENYIGIVHVLRKFAFSPGECYETVEWFGKAGLPHLMISDCMPPSPDFFPTSESVNDLTKLFLCKPSVQLFQDLQTLNNINHFLRGGIFSWVKHYLVLDYNRPISFFSFSVTIFPILDFRAQNPLLVCQLFAYMFRVLPLIEASWMLPDRWSQ